MWGVAHVGLRLGAFRSVIPRADAPRADTLDSRRFPSIPVDSAPHGRDATSRRVYERGRMYEGLATGSLSRTWDYALERSAAKSHPPIPMWKICHK